MLQPENAKIMKNDNYRIALAFNNTELTERVMNYLGICELAERPADADTKASELKRRFTADERQQEFVESRLRLAAWHISSSLAGWRASTDFDADDEVCISIALGYPYGSSECGLLGAMMRDWICLRVAREASLALFNDLDKADRLVEQEDDVRQRVLMFLCAADVMRRAS